MELIKGNEWNLVSYVLREKNSRDVGVLSLILSVFRLKCLP